MLPGLDGLQLLKLLRGDRDITPHFLMESCKLPEPEPGKDRCPDQA